MLKLKKVAITGGISCGKSLASKYLKELGAHVVDADKIVHKLLTPETDTGKKVIELLGPSIVVNGKIDRERVAKRVFLNPKLIRSLELILHPKVYEEIDKIYEGIKEKESVKLFAAEVPLLFESGGDKYFDHTIAVTADPELCWERYRKSTGYEREDFNRRMARQLPQHEKAEKSDFVIKNDGTPEELKKVVKLLFQEITKSSPKTVGR